MSRDASLQPRVRVAVHMRPWLPLGVTAIHAALTAVLWWWAFTLATPPETFTTGPAYRLFEVTWPYSEGGWALVFVVPGLLGVAGLMTPLRYRWTRLNLAAVLAFVHVLLALAVHAGNPAGTTWGIYVIFAALGLWRLVSEGNIIWEVR